MYVQCTLKLNVQEVLTDIADIEIVGCLFQLGRILKKVQGELFFPQSTYFEYFTSMLFRHIFND